MPRAPAWANFTSAGGPTRGAPQATTMRAASPSKQPQYTSPMRASRHASTWPAPPRIACRAKASSVVTGTTGRFAPKHRPWATATLILTPVNAPGPTLAATPSSMASDMPASASTASTMPRICSACPLATSAHRASKPSSVSNATEQASVAVSNASTRMLGACPGIARGGLRRAHATQPLGEKLRRHGAIRNHRTRRQSLHEHPAVGFGPEPRIAEYDHPEIIEITNQAPYPLFQGQHRLRQLILEKWIAAAAPNSLEARFEQRIIRRGKRQLIDGDDRQGLTLDVHAFPKAAGGEQHRIAVFAKSIQQRFARRLPLHQHRKRR